jgi:hypothetical protein
MGCSCRSKKATTAATENTSVDIKHLAEYDAATEALANDLPQCYECAKKHLGRAQIFFEEYHTGYPQHIKNLMCSLQVAEDEVRRAYLNWCRILAHLDMAANELLGNDINGKRLKKDHVDLAAKIREARLNLGSDPLYVPDFGELLTAIQKLEYQDMVTV